MCNVQSMKLRILFILAEIINMSTQTHICTHGKRKSISHTYVPFHWKGDGVRSIFKHKSRMFSESAASSVGNRCTQAMLAEMNNQKQVPLTTAQRQK